jgi:hypothetical protein
LQYLGSSPLAGHAAVLFAVNSINVACALAATGRDRLNKQTIATQRAFIIKRKIPLVLVDYGRRPGTRIDLLLFDALCAFIRSATLACSPLSG